MNLSSGFESRISNFQFSVSSLRFEFVNLGSGILNLKRVIAGGLVAVLAAPSPSFAQGCALCYNSAAALRAAAKHALNTGILVLLIPVLLMFGAVFVFAFRSQTRFADAECVPAVDRETELLEGCLPGPAPAARTAPSMKM